MFFQVSGDPRRPNELHAFKQLPPTADDQTPGALLLLSMGFGMSALLLKVRYNRCTTCIFGLLLMVCMYVRMLNTLVSDL